MRAQDIRVGAWSVQATAGTTRVIEMTWTADGVPFDLTGRSVALWVGGTVVDPSDTTGATQFAAVVAGNVATVTLDVPVETDPQALRLTLDGELVAIGVLYLDLRGSASSVLSVDVSVAPIELAISVFGVGTGGGGVTSVNGIPGPAVVLVAGQVPATPSEGLSGATVQAQLDQADGLFEQFATDLSALQDGVEAGLNGKVSSIVAGSGITVNAADPQNPIVTATGGGGGGVDTVNGIPGPDVQLDAVNVPATPSTSLGATDVQGQLDQANALFEATDTTLGQLNDDLVQVNADLDAHEALTTTAHGGIVADTDPRLADARIPTAHAASHQDGGGDELALDAAQITSGTLADGRIPAGITRDSELGSAAFQNTTAFDPAGAADSAQTAAESTAATALAGHAADTTDVHGITDSANLVYAADLTAGLAAKVDVPDPLIPKIVIGTTLETGVLGDVGYNDDVSAFSLAMRGFTGTLKAADPDEADDLTTRSFAEAAFAPIATATDARTPLAHVATHAVGGTDALDAGQVAALLGLTILEHDDPDPVVTEPSIYFRKPAP